MPGRRAPPPLSPQRTVVVVGRDELSWPDIAPRWGRVLLRRFHPDDAGAIMRLSDDPYIPQITTLPPRATRQQAVDWIDRQATRLADGAGYSFAIADASTGAALGHTGLWFRDIREGRTGAGYVVVPSARGCGVAADALRALTGFAWSIAAVHRVELYIEPWNVASIRTAERAGYGREGLMRSFMEIGGVRRDMLLFAAVRDAEDEPQA